MTQPVIVFGADKLPFIAESQTSPFCNEISLRFLYLPQYVDLTDQQWLEIEGVVAEHSTSR